MRTWRISVKDYLSLGLSVGAVSKYLRALKGCRIDAGEAEKLSEVELERRVFGVAPVKSITITRKPRSRSLEYALR